MPKHPKVNSLHNASSILNNDGKCYSFDTRGSGYGRGEGAAMVVLKRLDDAVRDGDNIRGIIRNSGVNHDGTTPGITLPNRDAQQTLINSVYQRAGLDPRDTAYIEAHGTGTAVGDVEEISAIQSIFEKNRDSQHAPLYVGSIKPNIGHLESARYDVLYFRSHYLFSFSLGPSFYPHVLLQAFASDQISLTFVHLVGSLGSLKLFLCLKRA
jgi:acyl transferase domain-containing protein